MCRPLYTHTASNRGRGGAGSSSRAVLASAQGHPRHWQIVLLVLLVGVLGKQVFGKETPQAQPQPRADVTLAPIPREHKHGRWVMSENGHATFCSGAAIKLGGFPRYA